MSKVKARLEQAKKQIQRIENQHRDAMSIRIQRLGYDSNEVLEAFSYKHKAGNARLMVWLEYQEINLECPMELIAEVEYAGSFYPEIILNYLHYLLDEVGVPPLEEIDIYKAVILKSHSELAMNMYQLEHKWRQYSEESIRGTQ
ncbi:hypothetical protein [Paenibacillus sp. FSL H8-0537]|uniref:hypothetical protein n=1 Tax=Paenibacillus sp. FSL H8-0537 TaxID=2921399 RepID=UPI003100FF6B